MVRSAYEIWISGREEFKEVNREMLIYWFKDAM